MNVGSVAIDGPPPPSPPAVVSRDNEGRATVRATRLTEPLVLDGRLAEDVYGTISPITDFIQQEPHEGQPATEKTEAWIFYDDHRVYVAVRCWSTEPHRIVANEMRRDNQNIFRNDNVTIAFDTFYDRRNGVFFQTNPVGGLRDGAVIDESDVNYDWSTVWDAKSLTFDSGWTSEIAIPFKSLRYRKSREQVWGFTIQRIVRGKNEISYIQRMPASYGPQALFKLSAATTLVGIEAPATLLNLEVKPYVIGDVTTNSVADPPISRDLGGNLGFDAKYGLTKSLTFDFTYNTDFAQVEADDQQVNLTRFSLFFPEKREFFLEGQGIFAFGGASTQARAGSGGPGEVPLLFFSRRIGLDDSQKVPIEIGGRLTGKAGKYTIGIVNIQTGDSNLSDLPSTTYSAIRLKRDIFRRSSIGVLVTQRSPSIARDGSNQVVGLDAALAFHQNVQINSFYARTRTPGLSGDDSSYRGQFRYSGDRYGLDVDHLKVGNAFNPEIGFVQRRDFQRNYAQVRFSPRPKSIRGVRKVSWEASVDHIADGAGRLETRRVGGEFGMFLDNGDTASISYMGSYEFLEAEFRIAKDIVLPVGGYRFGETVVNYQLGPQRRLTGSLNFTHGPFYSGDRTGIDYQGRVELTPQFSMEPRIGFNWIDLPEGNFSTTLVSTRSTYTFTPRMYVAALIQYNSSASSLGTKLRFRWEYEPGSDLFVVYADGRDTTQLASPALLNRSFVVKYTRLFRF